LLFIAFYCIFLSHIIYHIYKLFIFYIYYIMTRYTKSAGGHYLIHGKKYEMLVGSRAQVYHGTAYKTSGGLKKSELMQNKNGRMVSKAKHHTAKKERRLIKAGYGTKKGKFGFVKLGKTQSKRGKSMRGGSVEPYSSPSSSASTAAAV
jgi:hypothetical protein